MNKSQQLINRLFEIEEQQQKDFVPQSVVVKGKSRPEARKSAEKFGSPIKTKEVEDGFRFRLIDPDECKSGSFRTKIINNDISVVFCALK